MQATRIHLALVIDEYGGSDGLVSIEDLVELIVGDIADEHDEEEGPAVTRQADGSFLATGRASLEDVRAAIGEQFDAGEVAKEVDTLGGYLVIKAGHVPVRGELVPGPEPFEAEVLDADPRRVKRARIYLRKDRRPAGVRDLSSMARAAAPRPRDTARRTHSAKPEHAARAVTPKGLIHAIVLSWGWRRWLIAFAAGAASALAMAPFNAWPILFLTFPILVWLIDGAGVGSWGGVARGGNRLVVRFRLFSRRALLDRLRVSGRCADFRLAVADRGDRPAGGARASTLHSARRWRGCYGRAARGASSRWARR